MKWLALAYVIQFILFGTSRIFKMSVDPDMGRDEWRGKYLRAFYIKYAITAVIILVVWWYWYPIQGLLNFDLENLIQQYRPH